MKHFSPNGLGPVAPVFVPPKGGGAWFGRKAPQAQAMRLMDEALREGRVKRSAGWGRLDHRGCKLVVITQTDGFASLDVAQTRYNFPPAFSTVLYSVFDRFRYASDRLNYSRECLQLIVPGTDLDKVAAMCGQNPSYKLLKRALREHAPKPQGWSNLEAFLGQREMVAA